MYIVKKNTRIKGVVVFEIHFCFKQSHLYDVDGTKKKHKLKQYPLSMDYVKTLDVYASDVQREFTMTIKCYDTIRIYNYIK